MCKGKSEPLGCGRRLEKISKPGDRLIWPCRESICLACVWSALSFVWESELSSPFICLVFGPEIGVIRSVVADAKTASSSSSSLTSRISVGSSLGVKLSHLLRLTILAIEGAKEFSGGPIKTLISELRTSMWKSAL